MAPLPRCVEDEDEEHESKGLMGVRAREGSVAEGSEAAPQAKKMRIGSRPGDIALLGALCSSVFFSGCLSAGPTLLATFLSARADALTAESCCGRGWAASARCGPAHRV